MSVVSNSNNKKTLNFYKAINVYISMAGFDKSLDVEVFGKEAQFETSKIRVSVMSYNEGRPKLQISRENLSNDDGSWRWSKLGRMTKEEAQEVLPIFEEALKEME